MKKLLLVTALSFCSFAFTMQTVKEIQGISIIIQDSLGSEDATANLLDKVESSIIERQYAFDSFYAGRVCYGKLEVQSFESGLITFYDKNNQVVTSKLLH